MSTGLGPKTTTAKSRRWGIREWAIIVIGSLLGAAIGALIGHQTPIVYTGEVRLGVGSGEMSALSVPGYPTASNEMAANYARWVTNGGVGSWKPPEGSNVTASPIPESNIIRVEATSRDSNTALLAAQQASEALRKEVNRVATSNNPQAMLDEISKAGPDLARAKADSEENRIRYQNEVEKPGTGGGSVSQLKNAYIQAEARYQDLDTQQSARQDRYRQLISNQTTEADVYVVSDGAELSKNTQNSTTQRMGLLGLGAGAIASFLLASLLSKFLPGGRRRTQAADRHAATTDQRIAQ